MLFRICPRTRRPISIYTLHSRRSSSSTIPCIHTSKRGCNSSINYTRRNSDDSSCSSYITSNILYHQWAGVFRVRWLHPRRREWSWTKRNNRRGRGICERSEGVQCLTFTRRYNRAISSHLRSSSYTVSTTRMELIPVIEARRPGVSVRVQTTVQGVRRVGPTVVPPSTVRRGT